MKILSISDEVIFPDPSWTPKQFNWMWDQLTHQARVEFVKILMDQGWG